MKDRSLHFNREFIVAAEWIFTMQGTDGTAELAELTEGQPSESEKGWQQGFDLMEESWK